MDTFRTILDRIDNEAWQVIQKIEEYDLSSTISNFKTDSAEATSLAIRLDLDFECHERRKPPKAIKKRRNPVSRAKEWHESIENGQFASQAELARSLGVSRARVTQVLNLLKLSPRAIEIMLSMGETVPYRSISERELRMLVNLPATEQTATVKRMLRKHLDSPFD